ncbi:hypothetical protein [Streptomyces brasiliscabiei]|uniref:hypothetical protein n=1 Tax=Streptomyces brasiliscabiei TaxID=2736302 RepID=UPI001C123FBC|nr:hypothetical protein [Streptomyces brasiliscabiei]
MRSGVKGSGRIAVIGVALAGVLAAAAAGTAGAAASAVPCASGWVCLSENPSGTGRIYSLAQGAVARFVPAARVGEATNSTTVDYCVIGSVSYVLRPGETRTQPSWVNLVTPRTSGGTCPVATP